MKSLHPEAAKYVEEDMLSRITPMKEIVLFKYVPKTTRDKQRILEGNLPEELRLLETTLRMVAKPEVGIIDNMRWNYDKNDPYVTFEILRDINPNLRGGR